MDTLSHGLWGGVAFGRKSKASWWKAFVFGVAPDLVAFGPVFVSAILGFTPWPSRPEPPDSSAIPGYVYQVYNISHSLVIFAIVFFVVWLILRRPMMEMLAWPLHILVDIPTHSTQFFPTPFLWPLSSFHINGISWGHPAIFFPNVALLILSYYLLLRKRKKALA